MTSPGDLFPGFGKHRLPGDGVDIHARVGGSGPPVLLLHGYPQTHVIWHRVARRLATRFTVVAADLRGYGGSGAPPGDAAHAVYSKRAMAGDCVRIMRALGHERFAVVGHDRGGRVAYRLAFDQPGCVSRLAVLDILPTLEVWERLTWASAIAGYHWQFLAQPHPLPETLIAADPAGYVAHTLRSWTRTRTLDAFDPAALAEYRAALAAPERIHAVCEDYRAGATFDRVADLADREAGRRIACPTLVVWGSDYVGKGAADPLRIWQSWCDDVIGHEIVAGHFLAEENPDDLLARLVPFLEASGAPT